MGDRDDGRRRNNRRADIVKSATELFAEKGYRETTVRDLAEKLGILSGSLYAHIESKEDLFYEILEGVQERYNEQLDAVLSSELPADEKLRMVVRAYMEELHENLHTARIFFFEWRALSGERQQQLVAERDRYERRWNELLEQGVREGLFADKDLKTRRLALLGALNWASQWYDPEGAATPAEIADAFTDLFLQGLHSSPGGGRKS